MRTKHKGADDDDSIHQQPEFIEYSEFFREEGQKHGAEDDAECIVHSPQNHHGHHDDRKHELKVLRRNKTDIVGVQGARDAIEETIDTKREDLVPGNIDTRASRCDLVLPDGIPCQAGPGVVQQLGDEGVDQHKKEDQKIVVGLEGKFDAEKVQILSE